MAAAVVQGDISDNLKTVSKSEAAMGEFDRKIARQQLIWNSVRDALQHLLSRPVVSLEEYRSLRKGIAVTREALAELETLKQQATQVRNKALAALPALRRQLAKLEQQLETYEPPRVVLEFKPREQH